MLLKRILFATVLAPFLNHADPIPDWVFNPPQDSRSWFYSVGSGPTVEQAKLNALKDLSSRLVVNVQSTSQTFVSKDELGQQSFFEDDIKQTSESFNFKNISVNQSVTVNDKSYLVIQVARDNFFNDIKNQLSEQLGKFVPEDNDTTANKITKVLGYAWKKSHFTQRISLLKAYGVEHPTILMQLQKIKMAQSDLQLSLSGKFYFASDELDLSPLLTEHLKSVANNVSSENSLTLLVAGINRSVGKTKFHHSNKQVLDLSYVFEGQILYTQSVIAEQFAESPQMAESKTTAQLTNVLKEL